MDLRLAAVDLLLGGACPGCDRPAYTLCPGCRPALRPRPRRVLQEPVPTFAAAPHTGVARLAVLAWKERGHTALGSDLARVLASAVVPAVADRPAVLVPVPSSAAARRRRGADLVADLAVAAARELRDLGMDVEVDRLLRVRRRVADQAGLDAASRRANVRGAFGTRRRARTHGRDVVIVDDIVTTGATIAEAVRALGAQGVPVCSAAAALWRP